MTVQRTVITVGKGEGATSYWCQLALSASGGQLEAARFELLPAQGSEEFVRTNGAQLFDALCTNPKVKDALDRAISGNPNVQPIYFEPRSLIVQAIKWETLWKKDVGFLALKGWPIARRVDPQFDFERETTYKPPFRIFAVISAEDRPGEPEWNALYDAAAKMSTNGFPVEIYLMTSDPALSASLNGNVPKNVTVQAVPDLFSKVAVQMGLFKPHIVHFFCHGQIDAGGAWLQILTNDPNEPLQVSIDDLVKCAPVKKTWLVVLNSCNGAAPLTDALPMACQLVVKAGIPFAIGGAASVDSRDATAFAQAFYSQLLIAFSDAYSAAKPDDEITFEWAGALHAARIAIDRLYQNEAGKYLQWSLPILFERRDAFQIRRDRAPDEDEKQRDAIALRLKIVTEYIATLPPNTPDTIKRSLIDAALKTST